MVAVAVEAAVVAVAVAMVVVVVVNKDITLLQLSPPYIKMMLIKTKPSMLHMRWVQQQRQVQKS